MDQRTLKIATACGLGGFIGTIIAISALPYLWWLGLIGGAFVGYLSYEWQEVKSSLKRARIKTISWKPDTEGWKLFAEVWFAWFITWISSITSVSILLFLPGLIQTNLMGIHQLYLKLPATIIVISSILSIFFCVPPRPYYRELIKNSVETLQYYHPIMVFIVWPYRGIRWCFKNSPAIIRFFGRVARKSADFAIIFFRLIHSDLRLLCACDSAIGVAIGYFIFYPMVGTWAPIGGALAGALFGILNYEILSKRVLKLVSLEK